MFEAWTLRRNSVKAEEEQLREEVRALGGSKRAEYFRSSNHFLKDPDTYAVLNWFFLTGLHHFYLGKYLRGSINFLVMVMGIGLLFTQPYIGILLIAGIVLIELPALFRSQVIVADHNTKLGRRILKKEHVTSSSRIGHDAAPRL